MKFLKKIFLFSLLFCVSYCYSQANAVDTNLTKLKTAKNYKDSIKIYMLIAGDFYHITDTGKSIKYSDNAYCKEMRDTLKKANVF